jgi:hypothetical protein
MPAAQTIFLAEMRECAGNARKSSAFAHADLVVEPVDLTVARTNFARSQRFDRLLGALLKNALVKRTHVGGNKIFPRYHEASFPTEFERYRSVVHASAKETHHRKFNPSEANLLVCSTFGSAPM